MLNGGGLGVIYVNNLTQRIKNIMYVEPLDVTNPDSWDLQVDDDVFLQRQGNDLIAVNATTNIDQLMPDVDGYYRVNSFDQGVKVTISALDFGGYTKDIYVVIIPQQPNGFEFVANPLSVMEPSVFPGEITKDVYKNVKLTRNNVEMTDSTLFDRICRRHRVLPRMCAQPIRRRHCRLTTAASSTTWP